MKKLALLLSGLLIFQANMSMAYRYNGWTGSFCSSCSTIEIQDSDTFSEVVLKYRQAIAEDNGKSLDEISEADALAAIAYQKMNQE